MYLILGPASMGYYAMIGALKKMEHKLESVTEISGSSAGAMIGLFLTLGMKPDDILKNTLDIYVPDFVKINFACFLNKFGFVETDDVRQKMVDLCGCDPTFAELPLKFYVSAFCLNTSETHYFSVDTHPDMKVIDAVCMSIAIPFIFCAQKHGGMHYIDGGVAETYPMQPFLNKKPHEVVCIRLAHRKTFHFEITSAKQYLEAVLRMAFNNRFQDPTKIKTIEIDLDDTDIFNFNMTHEEKLKLFHYGFFS